MQGLGYLCPQKTSKSPKDAEAPDTSDSAGGPAACGRTWRSWLFHGHSGESGCLQTTLRFTRISWQTTAETKCCGRREIDLQCLKKGAEVLLTPLVSFLQGDVMGHLETKNTNPTSAS